MGGRVGKTGRPLALTGQPVYRISELWVQWNSVSKNKEKSNWRKYLPPTPLAFTWKCAHVYTHIQTHLQNGCKCTHTQSQNKDTPFFLLLIVSTYFNFFKEVQPPLSHGPYWATYNLNIMTNIPQKEDWRWPLKIDFKLLLLREEFSWPDPHCQDHNEYQSTILNALMTSCY